MPTIPKALRVLVRPEIRAVLEKIDALDSTLDSSYHPIRAFVRDAKLTVLERRFLRNALAQVERRSAMTEAMRIVITNYENDALASGQLIGAWDPKHLMVSNADLEAIKMRMEPERKQVIVRKKVRASS